VLSAPLVSISDFEREGLLDNGKPRLNAARSYFLGLRHLDFNGLVQYWRIWKDFVEYLVLQKQEGRFYEEKTTIAVKCSKRGNDVYWGRVKKRLGFIREIEDIQFFNPKDRGLKSTRAVFVTLTYDPKFGSVDDAWSNEGVLWNRWITNLREKYGKLSYIRTWESFINGYPHVHALLVFHDSEFRVFRHVGKDRKTRWRLEAKAEFESSWPAHVDVQGCVSLRSASLYITKYLTKRFHDSSEEALDKSLRGLTLSMNWIFRKRSFAVSRDLGDLIKVLHNSKSEGGQATLDGGFLPCRWVCLGVHSALDLGVDGSRWVVELSADQIDISWGFSRFGG
jgi:hypothetical protein